MDVLARPAQGTEVAEGDFADITSVPVTGIDWAEDGQLRITFAADLSATEQQRVRLRVTSSSTAQEQLRVASAAFLTNQSPTLADAIQQLRRLTRLVLTLDDGA